MPAPGAPVFFVRGALLDEPKDHFDALRVDLISYACGPGLFLVLLLPVRSARLELPIPQEGEDLYLRGLVYSWVPGPGIFLASVLVKSSITAKMLLQVWASWNKCKKVAVWTYVTELELDLSSLEEGIERKRNICLLNYVGLKSALTQPGAERIILTSRCLADTVCNRRHIFYLLICRS